VVHGPRWSHGTTPAINQAAQIAAKGAAGPNVHPRSRRALDQSREAHKAAGCAARWRQASDGGEVMGVGMRCARLQTGAQKRN
jgi:hypothetical protein